MSDADETINGREWATRCFITFYTATGHALRETMVSDLNHMDGRLHRQADRMAKRLGATRWAVFNIGLASRSSTRPRSWRL